MSIAEVKQADAPEEPSHWNNYFKVQSVDKDATGRRVKFTVEIADNPLSTTPNSGWLGVSFLALSGTSVLVENNRVWHATSGPHHDTWTRDDFILRNNYFYDIYVGLSDNLGASGEGYQSQASVRTGTGAYNSQTKLVTWTSTTKHGLSPGDAVVVKQDPMPTPPPPPPPIKGWGGNFLITVIDEYKFSYYLEEEPNIAGTNLDVYEIFQDWRVVAENNLIELSVRPPGAVNHGPPVGILLGVDAKAIRQFPLLHNLLVRGNLIRHFEGTVDPNFKRNTVGIRVDYGENVIMEDNLINLEDDSEQAIVLSNTTVVKTFNNKRTNGKHLRAWDFFGKKHYPDPQDDVDDLWLFL